MRVIRLMAYPHKEMELMTNGKQCRFTATDEFFTIVKNVSGQDLSWFRNVYFTNASLPVLSVSENEKGVLLKWNTKGKLDFPMPLEIKTKNGVIKVQFNNGLAQLDFGINNIIEIDPNKWILFSTSK
jgi:aminopeptidase N